MCIQNPRNLSVYPVYVGGPDTKGQVTAQNMYPLEETGSARYKFRQTILDCRFFAGEDVSRFQTGGFHSFVETVRVLEIRNGSLFVERALWAFGSNTHGQLGVSQNAGTNKKNGVPRLVPRFLFPGVASANEISEQQGNNVFHYWYFNTSLERRVKFSITI